MKYAYKTELKPTNEQALKIKESIDICCYLYNQYILFNKKLYKMYQRGLLDSNQAYFITAKDFDKYINNKVKVKQQFMWINNCGSKARKKAIVNAEIAFKRYFSGKTGLPKLKYQNEKNMAVYFPKNNITDWSIERHRIKIPTIGFVRIKEYGYLPIGIKVINGNVSYKAGRYYVSVTVEKENEIQKQFLVKNIVIKFSVSKDINSKENFLERRIIKAKSILNRKKKAGVLHSSNQEKQKLKIQKLYQRLDFLLTDKFNKYIAEIVEKQPEYIILPNLSDEIYLRDKTLLHRVYKFRNKLLLKCNQKGIKLRYEADFNKLSEDIEIITVKIS